MPEKLIYVTEDTLNNSTIPEGVGWLRPNVTQETASAGISQMIDPLADTMDASDFVPYAFFSNDSNFANWHKLYMGL